MQADVNLHHEAGNKPDDAATRKIELGHYLSAAFGGFLVGFGELLRAGSETTNVTVLRICAVLREQFSPLLGVGWVALVLMALFSTVLCSIYRPDSRKEAFTLGLSVFAILSAFTPQQQPAHPANWQEAGARQSSSFSFFSQARADEFLKKGEYGEYYFEFSNYDKRFGNEAGVISVFDHSEKHLLMVVDMNVGKISKLRLPKGSYVVQFECSGCGHIRADLDVDKPKEAARVTLSDSNVPLSLQRLFQSRRVDIDDVAGRELERIIKKYEAQAQQAQ